MYLVSQRFDIDYPAELQKICVTSLLSPNANGSSLYCRIPGMVPFPYGGGVGNRYNADIISLSEYGVRTGEGDVFLGAEGRADL